MKQPTRVSDRKTGQPAKKRQSREEMNAESRARKRDKKHRGNASGSRSNPQVAAPKHGGSKKTADSRIGSKKPIPLVGVTAEQSSSLTPAHPPSVKPPVLLPEQELAALESNPRLDSLLDSLEAGETLSADDQAWLDQTLDRIDVLMETLGIALDDDEDDREAEEDMYRLLKGNSPSH
ncbi:MAG: Der GTPase-activating protein YihI [Candidatus Erwinia impunctatus]|nr:Der GTPase-activating protein YihI [Culicoides impunctatus]